MTDEHSRRKIYLGSRDAAEKADDTLLVRKLVLATYERGLQFHLDGKPLPDSFVRLFGEEATITPSARMGDVDAFRHAGAGGAIGNRETLLLNILSGQIEGKISSTEGLKDSLLADMHCVSVIDNPVALVKQKQTEGTN